MVKKLTNFITPNMNDESLISYFSNEDFVLKTQHQIHKDFAKFNLEFPESFVFEVWTKEQIEEAIQERLKEIIKFGETRLLQLLYTIDIPENQFLNLVTAPDFLVSISQAILKREAMKVYFQSKF